MKNIKMYVLFLLLVIFVVGCSSNSNAGKENGANGAEEQGTLTIAQSSDIDTFDIHNYDDTITFAVHNNIFSSLFMRDENGELAPNLVDEYDNVDDLTWEFTLKDDITFHNGDPLTSEDVKFSLERLATDTSLKLNRYSTVEEVQVEDDLNFKIITKEPDPILLNRLSGLGSGIIPAEHVDEVGFDEFFKNPIGSGPYKFVEWIKDDKITLERFDDYFKEDNTDWDEVVFRVIPEASSRISELLTGGIDIAGEVPSNEWERIDSNDGTEVVHSETNRTITLEVNRLPGTPMEDERVLKAIDLAIDNQAIIDSIYGGIGTPTQTRILPGFTGANEEQYDTYDYDVEEAKKLLEEAGYGDGFTLTMATPATPGDYKDLVLLVGDMLGEVGIEAEVEVMEWGNWLDMIFASETPELTFVPQTSSMFDGISYSTDFYSETFPDRFHYKNDRFDEIMDEAITNMDTEEREQQAIEIQEILAEDLPVINLFQAYRSDGMSEQLAYEPPITPLYYVPFIEKK